MRRKDETLRKTMKRVGEVQFLQIGMKSSQSGSDELSPEFSVIIQKLMFKLIRHETDTKFIPLWRGEKLHSGPQPCLSQSRNFVSERTAVRVVDRFAAVWAETFLCIAVPCWVGRIIPIKGMPIRPRIAKAIHNHGLNFFYKASERKEIGSVWASNYQKFKNTLFEFRIRLPGVHDVGVNASIGACQLDNPHIISDTLPIGEAIPAVSSESVCEAKLLCR